MVDASDVFGNLFKVVTERNVVYLMGLVTQREAAHLEAAQDRQSGRITRMRTNGRTR